MKIFGPRGLALFGLLLFLPGCASRDQQRRADTGTHGGPDLFARVGEPYPLRFAVRGRLDRDQRHDFRVFLYRLKSRVNSVERTFPQAKAEEVSLNEESYNPSRPNIVTMEAGENDVEFTITPKIGDVSFLVMVADTHRENDRRRPVGYTVVAVEGTGPKVPVHTPIGGGRR